MSKVIPDIYHNDKITSWDKVKESSEFLILKATEGTTFVDPELETRIKECERKSIPYWLYAFLKKGDEHNQTKFLVSTCKGKVGKNFIGYILDIEMDNSESNCIEAYKWLKTQGTKTMVYLYHAQKDKYKNLLKLIDTDGCYWEARYGANDGKYSSKYPPHSEAALHQYTSRGVAPGIIGSESGKLDLNRLTGKKDVSWFKLGKKVKQGYTGKFPNLNVTVKDNSACVNDMLAWAKKYAADDSYKYKAWTSDKKTHQCPVCHPTSGKGWNCIGYVSAILYHGGRVHDITCACNGILSNGWAAYDSLTQKKWRDRNGKEWNLVVKQNKKVSKSKLKPGDVVICYSGKTYKHICMYAGDGYIYDATHKYGLKKRKYSSLASTPKVVFRYTGQKKEVIKVKTLSAGDGRSAEIKNLQRFLNWYGGYALKVDGIYGTKTTAAVKKFQKAVGLEKTGKFGKKSLAKAKNVKK